MTTLAGLLGPLASVPPTPAAATALRTALLPPKFRAQYPKTGEQSAPRCLDGADPYAYAVHHGVITPEEATPALLRWRDEELLNRGLGSGHPKAAAVWKDPYSGAAWLNKWGVPVPVTIQDCQHETMQQYLTGTALLNDATSIQAVTDLTGEILKDSTLDPKTIVVNSRQLGRPMRALLQVGTPEAQAGAGVLIGKVITQMDKKSGLAYYTLNTNAGEDHKELPINPQQESTILGGLALAYKVWPTQQIRDAIYLGVEMLSDVQMPNGSFANDAGWDADGNVILSDPGKVMDLWCVPALIDAKAALGNLWPGKAQAVLNKAKELWLATDYTKPSDVNWKYQNTLSITLACAAEWGFRQ